MWFQLKTIIDLASAALGRHDRRGPNDLSLQPWPDSGTKIFHQRHCRQDQNDEDQRPDLTHAPRHCWRHTVHHRITMLCLWHKSLRTSDRSRSTWATGSTVSNVSIIETWDRPGNARLIRHRSRLARAAGATVSGHMRMRNSDRLASYRSWLVRSAWPHAANSFCR